MAADFYRMTGPTEWAGPPKLFSHSALTAIEACPRRWQLERSRYGEFDSLPQRPSPAAVEGQIVHKTLEELFRVLAQRGLPVLGSDAFCSCIATFDVPARIRKLVAKYEERSARHPRGGAFRLRATAQDLANRTVRLFRAQYELARATHANAGLPEASALFRAYEGEENPSPIEKLVNDGVLAEQTVTHPILPFTGIVDLVWRAADGTHVADFKTGSVADEHRLQVQRYGVLWWCERLTESARIW